MWAVIRSPLWRMGPLCIAVGMSTEDKKSIPQKIKNNLYIKYVSMWSESISADEILLTCAGKDRRISSILLLYIFNHNWKGKCLPIKLQLIITAASTCFLSMSLIRNWLLALFSINSLTFSLFSKNVPFFFSINMKREGSKLFFKFYISFM